VIPREYDGLGVAMAIALILDLSVLDCHLVYIFHHFPSHEAVALWDDLLTLLQGWVLAGYMYVQARA
jgi:hypothetical protein